MPRLRLHSESVALSGSELELEFGELLLGRSLECNVRFDAESKTDVSRRHAVISRRSDAFFVHDQNSTYGTFVNGRRVTATRLVDSDVIRLGRHGPELRVRITDDGGAPRRPAGESPSWAATTSQRLLLADLASYDPLKQEYRRYRYVKLAFTLSILVVGVFSALFMLLLTFFGLGFSGALVGVLVAFVPAPFYLLVWLWLDRYDPEPAWALASAFVWGAGVATLISFVLGSAFGRMVGTFTSDAAVIRFMSASISAPVVEEACKGVAVVLFLLLLRREFDGILDGIVYAGVVALGFATVENVIYYGGSFTEQGGTGLFVTFFFRGVLGPFSHAVFTSMVGIGCGIARETHRAALRIMAPLGGYIAAVLLHFLWNTLAGLLSIGGLVLSYLFIWAPLFLAFLGFVLYTGLREARLIRRMLELEVARGLLTPEELDIVCSWPRRLKWVLGAVGHGGLFSARRRFLSTATRLALSYWHLERAVSAGQETVSGSLIPAFRKELATIRNELAMAGRPAGQGR
ncbi:MAG: PrsW family intramembrane metalloprotease [Acidobacteria bacterium]|nr:PrsW family intramembrane metalloprotease [Acidobacteriota bacterium]